MAKDTVEEQTQKAFAPKSAADLYREQQTTTGRQKGTGVGDLIVEGVSDTVSAIKEDPKGAAMGVVTGLKDEFNEFRSDPKEYVKDAVEGAVTGTVNFLTKNEEDRLLEKFGKTFKEATNEQVTEIRKDTLSDAMIAAGVIPGVGQAGKVTGKALYKATGPGGAFEYDPTQLSMFIGPKSKNPPTENLKEAFEADGFDVTDSDTVPIETLLRIVDGDLFRQKKDPTYQLRLPNTLKALGENGWFKGTDKKWKFEISDKSATFGDNREIELKQNILNRLAMPKSEIDNLDFSDPKITLPSSSAAVPLGYLLKHNTLYSQYPDLAGYPIVVDSDLAGKATQGYQNSRGFIAVSPDVLNDPEKLKSILLHEIMHSIQDEEGFGQGTSTGNSDVRKFYDFQTNLPEAKAEWADYNKALNVYEKDVTSKTKNLNKNLKDFIEKNGTSGTIDDLQEIMEDAKRLDFFIEASKVLGSDSVLLEGRDLTKYTQRSADLLYKIIETEFTNKDGFFDISGKEKLYKRFMEKIGVDPFKTNFPDLDYFEVIGVPYFNKPLPKYLDPNGNFDYSQRYDIYRRKMGEVESRLVSDRMNLDESEIKTEPLNPDVPPDEQWSDSTLSLDMYLQNAKNQKNKRRTTGIKFLPEDKNNTQGFAQGGLADMNTQTQKAFALGGEAETVDPVSGNDVPPGSLPEEVRDDIDAKLSEGEYVVPADVVRYYGVKFFENLRTKAKQGLQQMDEDGRIGGEPTLEMSLPFDISELEVEDDDGMRMAVGGLVAEYAVGGYTGVGSSFGGYGGYTGYKPYDPTVQPVTTSTPTPVATTTAAPTIVTAGPRIETYYRPDGTPVPITFINGKPQQSVQGLTKKNPNEMDEKETYNPLEGAKLNALGQPVKADGITPIDPSEYGKLPFGTIDALFGTSARKERQLADYQSALKDPQGLTGLVEEEVTDLQAINNPGFFKRITNNLTDFGVAIGVGALTTPLGGAAAGVASKQNRANQSIADAKVTQMVLEKQKGVDPSKITGGASIYRNTTTDPYTPAEKAWMQIQTAIDNVKGSTGLANKAFDDLFMPDIQKAYDALGFKNAQSLADQTVADATSSPTDTQSAAQTAYDGRLNLAKTKWAVQDLNSKDRESWSVAPTEETYKKYVNIGRQSEKITAKGQVMRTQADAYHQNRADDASAASKRAGERSKARNQGYKGKTGQAAVDQFNADNADDIRTKYGGNKETDSNGDDGCFLTTAIVEHRGESDDGPTLTKLRHFRDTYLIDYPEEVKKYYSIAPKIVAAIPKNSPEWNWVGTQIDSAIQDIDNNMLDKAHKTYKNMVLKLETKWLN